jgi:hypothetical protein
MVKYIISKNQIKYYKYTFKENYLKFYSLMAI